MAVAAQKSIQNAKGKFLQPGDEIKWGVAKGAWVGSDRAAKDLRKAIDSAVHGNVAVVDAPAEAVTRITKVISKAPAKKKA